MGGRLGGVGGGREVGGSGGEEVGGSGGGGGGGRGKVVFNFVQEWVEIEWLSGVDFKFVCLKLG